MTQQRVIKHQRSKSDQPKDTVRFEDEEDNYQDEPEIKNIKSQMHFSGTSKPAVKTHFLDSNQALI